MSESTAAVQRYLDRPLDELMDELAVYYEQVGGASRGPGDAWQKLEPALRKRVCEEWNWCERRQDARFDGVTNLAALLATIVAPALQAWPIPAALLAVILAKRGVDAFCNCPPLGARQTS